MGKSFAPSYSNIYMGYWEQRGLELSPQKPALWLRYIDDIFGVWHGTRDELVRFHELLDGLDPNIRLQLSYSSTEVNFLDTTVFWDREGDSKRLATRVFFKPTDSRALIHRDSFHPRRTFKGVVKSQLIRYARRCSRMVDFDAACTELLSNLVQHQGYNRRFLRNIKYEVLAELGFYPTRRWEFGFLPCNPARLCKCCQAHARFTSVCPGSASTTVKITISQRIDCNSVNAVYTVFCRRCSCTVYVGETVNSIRARMLAHVGDIRHARDTPVARHFSNDGHSLEDFAFTGVWTRDGSGPKANERRQRQEAKLIAVLKTLVPHGANELAGVLHNPAIPLIVPHCAGSDTLVAKTLHRFVGLALASVGGSFDGACCEMALRFDVFRRLPRPVCSMRIQALRTNCSKMWNPSFWCHLTEFGFKTDSSAPPRITRLTSVLSATPCVSNKYTVLRPLAFLSTSLTARTSPRRIWDCQMLKLHVSSGVGPDANGRHQISGEKVLQIELHLGHFTFRSLCLDVWVQARHSEEFGQIAETRIFTILSSCPFILVGELDSMLSYFTITLTIFLVQQLFIDTHIFAVAAIAAVLMQTFGRSAGQSDGLDGTELEILEAVMFENETKISRYLQKPSNVDRLFSINEMTFSPLHFACEMGKDKIVEMFIRAHADVNLQRKTGECSPSDSELSHQLHSALEQSGFTESRAALQSAAADVLQQILRSRLNVDNYFVVGSYSEGWGNSLTTLDGRTDANSDIDVMHLIPGREYHQKSLCECDGAPEQHELVNGHIQCSGFASNPANATPGCTLRPALDNVSACRLCRYPPIAPLLPNRVSNIPHAVLEALRKVLTSASSPCHVVYAASPDRGGEELRVSTSFLENRMLRSLTTLQGQLFVTLKYLVKKVICHKNGFNQQGLKSYHVKTITFRMVDETPVEQWKKENLVSLTRQSLQMLLDCVEKSREQDRQTPDTPDRSRGRIMNHFFLSDAAIYLKGADKERADQHLDGIMSTLRTVIDRLPQLLQQFIGSLRPVSDSGTFYFHPFQILPDLRPMPLTKSSTLEYYQIYDVVRECLVRLSRSDCSQRSQESLTELIARLPDCALSAREALRALACLKFGYRGTAERVVSSCSGHSVSRGIAWSREKSATEATVEFVMRHLSSRDSAWKFCFEFDQRPKLEFLTGALRDGADLFYMNFDALLWALRLELRTDREARAQDWIRDVAEREDSDEQELLVAALNSSNLEQVQEIVKKLR
uniref:ANK_REP_REGION domain-containing protein n=1 Tax=Macrostomum lignano TaxID=282301 RepID=A0A1I8IQQ8_9PLAT